ncbi:MAG: tetratricopeptide repeat-containing sulfotransferase family protein [Alphaproteobacteria bacterium]
MHEPTGPDPASLSNEQLLRAVSQAVRASNLPGAAQFASVAIARGLRHPTVFNARALWLEEQGRYREALGEYSRSRELTPNDANLLNAMGLCLLRLNAAAEAIKVFEQAIAIDPLMPDTYYRKGWAEVQLGQHDAAEQSYRRALELRPDYPEALSALSEIEARSGRLSAAQEHAARALQLDPRQPAARVTCAMMDIAKKDFSSAENQLRSLLAEPVFQSGQHRANALGFLGDALDGQGRYAEAFASYTASNEELLHIHSPRFAGVERAVDLVERVNSYFVAAPASRWAPPHDGVASDAAGHVFLAGFMRSGTTLLEQALGSSRQVATLDEREILAVETESFLSSDSGLNRLAELGADGAADLARTYWQRVRELGLEVAGKVLVDKQPLHSIKLPLFAKLFPHSKVIFAIRDPRDVVFSCFRRHFEVGLTTLELLRIEDAARYYSSVMHLVEAYRGTLQLKVHEHRYEDLITDFEGRMRSVCQFIGIDWTDDMQSFHALAPPVPLRSPSAEQVRRPLYSDAIGAWKNYASQLAPALPILRPWIEKFGYRA